MAALNTKQVKEKVYIGHLVRAIEAASIKKTSQGDKQFFSTEISLEPNIVAELNADIVDFIRKNQTRYKLKESSADYPVFCSIAEYVYSALPNILTKESTRKTKLALENYLKVFKKLNQALRELQALPKSKQVSLLIQEIVTSENVFGELQTFKAVAQNTQQIEDALKKALSHIEENKNELLKRNLAIAKNGTDSNLAISVAKEIATEFQKHNIEATRTNDSAYPSLYDSFCKFFQLVIELVLKQANLKQPLKKAFTISAKAKDTALDAALEKL